MKFPGNARAAVTLNNAQCHILDHQEVKPGDSVRLHFLALLPSSSEGDIRNDRNYALMLIVIHYGVLGRCVYV